MGRTWYLSHVCCVLSPQNYMLFNKAWHFTPPVNYHVHCRSNYYNLLLLSLCLFPADLCILSVNLLIQYPVVYIYHVQISGESPYFWFWLWDFEFWNLEFWISIDKYQVWALSVHGESERVGLIPGKLAHLLSACKNFPCWHQMSQRWRELFLWVLSGVGGWLIAQLDWFVFLIFIYMSTDKYKRHSRAIC